MGENTQVIRKPLVLVASDDTGQRQLICGVLDQFGFRTMTADDGKSAFLLFRKHQPDAVILDVQQGESDGFAACEAIRNQDTGRETPIFIVTERDDEDSIERAYRLAATDIVFRPVSLPVLPHRIRYALRNARSLSDLAGLVRAIPDLIFVVNEQGEVQDGLSGPDATHTLQLKALTTASQIHFYPCENDDGALECIKRALQTGKPQVYEHVLDSLGIHLETRFVTRDKNTVLAIVRDITERKSAEAKIFNLAYYDELTELPNRELFGQSLERTIALAKQEQQKFAVLFVDLDRFKRINDTLGHTIGDELLKDVAARLSRCTRSTDSFAQVDPTASGHIKLARLGGDEFVIKLYGVDSEESVSLVATRIIDALTPPFTCAGHQFVVTPSIGIALYPQDGQTGEELLMNADSAMYRAKSVGRNNFKFYSETMRTKSLHRLDLENLIRTAIQEQQFELHYQPKVDAETFRLVGAEALLRWNHPERGAIAPDDFIPIAEETGLIIPLGQWVLVEACKQVKVWSTSPVGAVPVSVNISSRQFRENGLIRDVLDAVSLAGIQASQLELEITESVMLQDVEKTLLELKVLKEAGVSLSIDDFGTGYSSLSYLKRFPIDTIKIDRSFVQDLHLDTDDAAICAAILAMSRQLGLNVVAEGVETREQLEFLRKHKCNHIQGHICSKPLTPEAFFALLVRISGRAANSDHRAEKTA
ncbi:MAG: EAL domain-containing protein [Gammaproteobacteria bacterium]|nr:EAL domain-containing protein [Gammaproteobacteria bacterium]MDH5304222.1 EAL domain-containing protein [Gammaproteobacteria bacterium]MDH5322175.1 EAL domain-containing protein [Gammaproteobacteria bacterium]